MNEWKERLTKLFKKLGRESMAASELREHFDLDRSVRQEFKHILRALAEDGFLRFDQRKRIFLNEPVVSSLSGRTSNKDKNTAPKGDKPNESQGEAYKLKAGILVLKSSRWWVQDKVKTNDRFPLTGVRPGLEEGMEVKYRLQKSDGKFAFTARISSGEAFNVFKDLAEHFKAKQKLPPLYPEAALLDIAERKSPAEEGLDGREDLRHLQVLCIDPLGARDHDDAISLEKTEKGGYLLGVHIADVSHYVLPETALDQEAYGRSYTQYLPWEAVPMLPEQLSSGWCSLVENEDRYAFSCLIELGPLGALKSYRFAKTVVRVTRSITYEQAQVAKDSGDVQLVDFAEMCEKLRSLRSKHGILLLDMPESKVQFDEQGNPIKIVQRQSIPSMNWIEECMLLANQCCARFLSKNKLNGIYRVHEPPPKVDIQELAFEEPDLFRANPAVKQMLSEPDAEGHGRNVDPVRFKLYMSLVEAARGDTLRMRKILRSMSKARYGETSDGHFALNWEDYSHFTSPIRRYADLWVHREMSSFLMGNKSKKMIEVTAEVCDYISDREILNMKCERQAVKLCATWIMKDRVGEQFEGVISGMEHFGIFIEIPETGAEGLMRFQDMDGDFYEFVPEKDSVVGRRSRRVFRRGDRLEVILSKVNLEDAQIDFVLVREPEAPRRPVIALESQKEGRKPRDSSTQRDGLKRSSSPADKVEFPHRPKKPSSEAFIAGGADKSKNKSSFKDTESSRPKKKSGTVEKAIPGRFQAKKANSTSRPKKGRS